VVKMSVVHSSENKSYSRCLVFITLKAFEGERKGWTKPRQGCKPRMNERKQYMYERVRGLWNRYVHRQACGLAMLSNIYQEALYGQDQSEHVHSVPFTSGRSSLFALKKRSEPVSPAAKTCIAFLVLTNPLNPKCP
jgi:hypothetical protein